MTPRRRAALLVKIGVTVTLLTYLAGRLDWREIARLLTNIDESIYGAAVLVLASSYAMTTVRWQLLLAGQGLALRIRSAISIDLIALFFNSFLPGSTGGDAMSVYYASALLHGELNRLVASIIMDRLIGLTILLMFGYLAFVLRPGIAARFELLQEVVRWLPLALGIGFAGCMVALFVPPRRLPALVTNAIDRASHIPIVGSLVEFARHLRRKPHVLVLAAVTTIAAQLVGFLAAYLVARSIGIALD